VLETTVTRYNTFVAQGADADFGRNPAWIAAIETPPVLRHGADTQLREHAGRPQAQRGGPGNRPRRPADPRLYSAGELGSIYAYNYNAGGNVGECFAFGRVAGRNAAREKPLEESEAVPSR
jgi:hypothetical protein